MFSYLNIPGCSFERRAIAFDFYFHAEIYDQNGNRIEDKVVAHRLMATLCMIRKINEKGFLSKNAKCVILDRL